MMFEVPDTFGITWCTSSLTTASKGRRPFAVPRKGTSLQSFGRTVILQAIYFGGRNTCLAERSGYRARAALRNDRKCKPCGRAGALTRGAPTLAKKYETLSLWFCAVQFHRLCQRGLEG